MRKKREISLEEEEQSFQDAQKVIANVGKAKSDRRIKKIEERIKSKEKKKDKPVVMWVRDD